MNKKCGWAGLLLVALPLAKAGLVALNLPFLVPFLDHIPGVIDAICTGTGAAMLAVSHPLHK